MGRAGCGFPRNFPGRREKPKRYVQRDFQARWAIRRFPTGCGEWACLEVALRIALFLLLSLALVGCGSTSFSGGGATKTPAPKAAEPQAPAKKPEKPRTEAREENRSDADAELGR